MRLPSHDGADGRHPVKPELLRMVLAVVVVDALFIAGLYLFHLDVASDPIKIGYTLVWTAVTLVIVLRGLVRIRAMRSRVPGHGGLPRG